MGLKEDGVVGGEDITYSSGAGWGLLKEELQLNLYKKLYVLVFWNHVV